MTSAADDLGQVVDPDVLQHDESGKLRFERLSKEHQNRKRFGEPAPEREREFSAKMRGQYAKIGSAPNGVVATKGTVVMVDSQPFTGATKFPDSITSQWRQGGDVAVLAENWLADSYTVLVRRQTMLDAKWFFSGEMETFLVSTSCMVENHVLSVSWVNMFAGFFPTNVLFRDPEICVWLSNRRGVPYEDQVSDYLQYISMLSGPVGVCDAIKSDLANFSSLMTNEQFASVSARNVKCFEGLIVALKPDFSMRNGVVVFVTLWKDVYALRERSSEEYVEALEANCVHRTLYDFERFMFDIKGALSDLQCASDVVMAATVLRDYVSLKF